MSGFFQRHVVHNFGLKVLSLLLATGLWFMISRDEQPAEVAISSPIVFQNVPSQLEISQTVPEAVIRVRGPERIVRHLTTNEVQAEIDLAGVTSGERTFELTAHQVRHPRELEVVQIVPAQLHLAFDTRLTREVPVTPRLTGVGSEQIVKQACDPPSVTITGPLHHVEHVAAATTDPIDASEASGTAVFTTNVYVPDPLVQVQPTSVRVTVVVQKAGAPASH